MENGIFVVTGPQMDGNSYRLVFQREVIEFPGGRLPLDNIAASPHQQGITGQLKRRDLDPAIVCPRPGLALAQQMAFFVEFQFVFLIKISQGSALTNKCFTESLLQAFTVSIRRSGGHGKRDQERQQKNLCLSKSMSGHYGPPGEAVAAIVSPFHGKK